MTMRTERSTIVMGETTENMGSSFLKKHKAEFIEYEDCVFQINLK